MGSAEEECWSNAQGSHDTESDGQFERGMQDPNKISESLIDSDSNVEQQVSRPQRARISPKRLTNDQVGEPTYSARIGYPSQDNLH